MACFRRRWTVVMGVTTVIMFSLNMMFLVDLTVNHHAHSHLISVLQEGTAVGGKKPWSLVDGGGEDVVKHEEGGKHEAKQLFSVEVLSSKDSVEVRVEEKVYDGRGGGKRGIHVVVLNQGSGKLMAARVFDTYMPGAEKDMINFLNGISDGRVLCLAILDEGTFSLRESGRAVLTAIGSHLSNSLSWRDMWALVTIKGAKPLGEDVGKSLDISQWGPPVHISVTVPTSDSIVGCDWPKTKENIKRLNFCSKYEGYGSLCHCAKPLPLNSNPHPLSPNNIADVPLAVIASNRPLYLFRTLKRLLSVAGADPSMMTVFIDGFFQEPKDVTELLGIRAIQHEPKSQKNGRISQHYKASLRDTFNLYPYSTYAIIIEEDIDVAPDFFSYFSQTLVLMEEDESIYCVSAWNDQGYKHSCEDPTLLYRVETMPGLGWLLKRSLFEDELEPNWPSPEKLWDWDMWMRMDVIRKGRECIIPDVSRTFHFGASGLNMNPYFHDHYFKNHVINNIPNVTIKDVRSLLRENYELVIHKLFREGNVLNHNKDPCDSNFIPNTKGKIYIVYITMTAARHYDHWMKLATCFKLWDLDARGFHKGLWRFWMKGNQVLVVGHPFSPYSLKYKPSGIIPFTLVTPTQQKQQTQ